MICKNCTYFNFIRDDIGECRKKSPDILYNPLKVFTNNDDNYLFPMMKHEDWCGEFKAKRGVNHD